jgi:GNAT superfamily N-acetyltransferase
VLEEADRSYAAAWRAFLTAAPDPAVVERSAVMVSSGIPVGLFNPAFVLGPQEDPVAVVAEVRAHYDALGTPFALYLRDGVAPGVSEAASAAGLVEHYRPPLMVLDPIERGPGAAPGDPELEVVVLAEEHLEAYGRVLASAFGMPESMAGLLVNDKLLEAPGVTGLLGLADGEPVATSAVHRHERIAGIYNVAVRPDAGGNGFGTALTWAAVRHGAQDGAELAVLQASEAGRPVYERMGFATPDRYRQFEPPQP